nr:hypothetical protein [Tanacetum cinerariifolium]
MGGCYSGMKKAIGNSLAPQEKKDEIMSKEVDLPKEENANKEEISCEETKPEASVPKEEATSEAVTDTTSKVVTLIKEEINLEVVETPKEDTTSKDAVSEIL